MNGNTWHAGGFAPDSFTPDTWAEIEIPSRVRLQRARVARRRRARAFWLGLCLAWHAAKPVLYWTAAAVNLAFWAIVLWSWRALLACCVSY